MRLQSEPGALKVLDNDTSQGSKEDEKDLGSEGASAMVPFISISLPGDTTSGLRGYRVFIPHLSAIFSESRPTLPRMEWRVGLGQQQRLETNAAKTKHRRANMELSYPPSSPSDKGIAHPFQSGVEEWTRATQRLETNAA